MSDLMQRMSMEGLGNFFSTPLTIIGSTIETDFLLFKNPTDSGKIARIWEQVISLPGESNADRSIIRIYRNPTIVSDGTPLSISGFRVGQKVAACQAFLAPVISARGIQAQIYNVTYQPFQRRIDLTRFVPEDTSFLVTFQGSKNNLGHAMTQTWVEVEP